MNTSTHLYGADLSTPRWPVREVPQEFRHTEDWTGVLGSWPQMNVSVQKCKIAHYGTAPYIVNKFVLSTFGNDRARLHHIHVLNNPQGISQFTHGTVHEAEALTNLQV